MKNNQNYDVNYFIEKFSKIDEKNFITKNFNRGSAYCANGHCGVNENNCISNETLPEEAKALQKVFSKLKVNILDTLDIFPIYRGVLVIDGVTMPSFIKNYSTIAALINNGLISQYQQPTPKQRILAALYDIKILEGTQEPKVIIEYRTVEVDNKVKNLAKEELILN